MHIKLRKASESSTISWANGTSTELFISPSTGDFQSRDFDFRISTATVMTPTSTFTFFEGITRHLMILKGELTLTHHNRYTKVLSPYDQDTFSGEWETTSIGQVTDFNLLLKNGFEGKLIHQELKANEKIELSLNEQFNAVFIAEGTLTFSDQQVVKGDLVLIDLGKTHPIHAYSTCQLILIQVNNPQS